MAGPLRHCPHCRFSFEGSDTCPACRRTISTAPKPPEHDHNLERKKTRKLPVVSPRTPKAKAKAKAEE